MIFVISDKFDAYKISSGIAAVEQWGLLSNDYNITQVAHIICAIQVTRYEIGSFIEVPDSLSTEQIARICCDVFGFQLLHFKNGNNPPPGSIPIDLNAVWKKLSPNAANRPFNKKFRNQIMASILKHNPQLKALMERGGKQSA